METSRPPEAFSGLLLRDRLRTGLLQRELATRAHTSTRSLQDWEAGVTLPSAERLQRLIQALLEAGGFTHGVELREARELWAAVERESPRTRAPFDDVWFNQLAAAPLASDAQLPSRVGRSPVVERVHDWGEAPDTTGFVGRGEELARVRAWVREEQCRLVTLLGLGGIGKTTLAARVAQDIAPEFERVSWRSLHNAPPVGDWLAGIIGFLSDQEVSAPSSESEQLTTLLQLLRDRRCLLILDNAETLFEPGEREGRYRAGLAGYGRLFQLVAETAHRSCVLLTSREAPPELVTLGSAARSLELMGLGAIEAQALLADKQLDGDAEAWLRLVERYDGNGLALKIVGETIRQVYDGDVATFLRDVVAGSGGVFGGIRRLLDAQAQRLSSTEYRVLERMAIEREPISLAQLATDMPAHVARSAVIEAIENLRRRSLVERGDRGATFSLQSMVLEYVTDRLVETAAEEIQRNEPRVLVQQPLIKAQAKDYVRQTQERLIGETILHHLGAQLGVTETEQQLLTLLDDWRGKPRGEQGFGPGNVVNLLRLQRGNLRHVNLSRLAIRQAYLQEAEVQDASLADAHVTESVFAEAFGYCAEVALSADGAVLAAALPTGDVGLWRVADRTVLATLRGHTGSVWGVALFGDGRLVASGGVDGTVRLWDSATGSLDQRNSTHLNSIRKGGHDDHD